MKALLLAAGRSKRVKPIEDKNFLRFCGKYLIEHQMKALKKAGFSEIIVVGGAHNLQPLKEVAKNFSAQVVEQKELDEGMAGAVLSAETLINDEPLLIMSSNDVVEDSVFELLKKAVEGEGDAFLLAYRVKRYFPGGYLKVNGLQIESIVEKPLPGEEPSDLINLVYHIHRDPKALFAALKKVSNEKDDRYELALDALMREKTFKAIPYDGFWQAIKHPWHVLDLMKFFMEKEEARIDPSAQIADSAIIKGKVVIEAGVKVLDNAVIQGPAYIGKNSVVANNALVRESCVGERSVVGFTTEVARSYIGDDAWFHSNYIGDSIIGDQCSFGAGAVTANLRLDEKEIGDSHRNKLGAILGDRIRIGVNTSLMPGVRVGSDSMIGSGLIIAEDIEPKKYVTGKTELVIKENRAILDPEARNAMLKSLKS